MQGLTINGTASPLAYLPAAAVTAGTTLDFSLGSSADTGWVRRPPTPAVVRRDTRYWR